VGGGERQVHVAQDICLRVAPTLDRSILERPGKLLIELQARHAFPGDWRRRRCRLLGWRLLRERRPATENRNKYGRGAKPAHRQMMAEPVSQKAVN
jgi:hypothetical protein